METKKILVPYNFTRQDEKVLEYVVTNYSGRSDIQITLFHLFTPLTKYTQVKRGSVSSPVVSTTGEKTGRKITYLKDKENEFTKLKNMFIEKGIPEKNLHISFTPKQKRVGDEIVGKAVDEFYDIVILSHSSKKERFIFGENVHEKVLDGLNDKVIIFIT